MIATCGHEDLDWDFFTDFQTKTCRICKLRWWKPNDGGGWEPWDQEISPCIEGYHDWREVGDPDDRYLECSLCGMIDV